MPDSRPWPSELQGPLPRQQIRKASPTKTSSTLALNLEYLESEYYLRPATGQGLSSKITKGVGTQGKVVGGSKVPFKDSDLEKLALEIGRDEEAHVNFLRSALGSAAVAQPEIDLQQSFTNLARLAKLVGEEDTFNPFENERDFLIGAYIFEDVGVTAFHAPLRF